MESWGQNLGLGRNSRAIEYSSASRTSLRSSPEAANLTYQSRNMASDDTEKPRVLGVGMVCLYVISPFQQTGRSEVPSTYSKQWANVETGDVEKRRNLRNSWVTTSPNHEDPWYRVGVSQPQFVLAYGGYQVLPLRLVWDRTAQDSLC
jgi:hypothetical protein